MARLLIVPANKQQLLPDSIVKLWNRPFWKWKILYFRSEVGPGVLQPNFQQTCAPGPISSSYSLDCQIVLFSECFVNIHFFFKFEQDFDILFNYFKKISLDFSVLGRLWKGKFSHYFPAGSDSWYIFKLTRWYFFTHPVYIKKANLFPTWPISRTEQHRFQISDWLKSWKWNVHQDS